MLLFCCCVVVSVCPRLVVSGEVARSRLRGPTVLHIAATPTFRIESDANFLPSRLCAFSSVSACAGSEAFLWFQTMAEGFQERTTGQTAGPK